MSNYKFRFGTLKAAEIKTAASGVEYARFAIDAGKFTAYCVAFDAGLIKAIMAAEEGDKVNAGGYLDVNKSDDGAKTYVTLITHSLKIGEGETLKAAKKGEADEVEFSADDLTVIKGVGPKAAERLAELGFLTFASLAGATPEQQAILDEEVPAVKGALSRNDVFAQAAALAS